MVASTVRENLTVEDDPPIHDPPRCPTCKRTLPMEQSARDVLREQVGLNIRRARLNAGMTQDDVAANFDPPLSRQSVTRVENGDQSMELDRLLEFAGILGVDWRDLLRGV